MRYFTQCCKILKAMFFLQLVKLLNALFVAKANRCPFVVVFSNFSLELIMCLIIVFKIAPVLVDWYQTSK